MIAALQATQFRQVMDVLSELADIPGQPDWRRIEPRRYVGRIT
jgi:hypothetical protein